MTNPTVYPVTADLERRLDEMVAEGIERPPSSPEFSRQRIRDLAAEYLGEYEHGSVDVGDLLPDTPAAVFVMREVLVDFIGTLFYLGEAPR